MRPDTAPRYKLVATPVRTMLLAAMFSALIGFPGFSAARPGDLSDAPLYLGTQVQPNIFFVIDDSGSMDWEVLLSAGALTAHPWATNSGDLDFTPDNDEEVRELCAGYNVLAYSPTSTYTPWAGVDEDGLTYTNKTLSTALNNPYDNDDIDSLSNHYYFVWTDSDGDGEYDNGECPTAGGAVTKASCATMSGCVVVDTLSATEQTNYANWYTYYRKREYVAKRAVSELVDGSTARVGLATLHNNNSVSTAVSDMTNATNKQTLLGKVFRISSNGGTPLRRGLREAGEYFNDTDTETHEYLGSAASPILPADQGGECQQNFTILMSDGYWNGTSPGVGNTDGDNNSSWDGGAQADGYDNTLADVAMKYYETDLSALTNNVPTTAGVDENEAQHMVTFTVAFGVDGTLTVNPPNRQDPFAWPLPVADTPTAIDDMRHAAWNARGDFLSAGNPGGLIDALNDAIQNIQDRLSTASAVAFNTARLSTNSLVYQAQFSSTRWSGDLVAFALDPISGAVATTPTWHAAQKLDAQTSRNIFTYNKGNNTGIRFNWDDLTTAQKNDLRTSPAGATETDDVAQARLNYIRGDRSNEGTAGLRFRTRDSRLGDIVHSSPVFVGPPQLNYPSASPFPSSYPNRYIDFKYDDAVRGRTEMVYVASNDGMLHGFRASSDAGGGEEVMAYVPSMLFSTGANAGLHYLTDANYSHRYYADIEPTVTDVYIADEWRTVLVGGLRGGGRGLYALDVTDPSAFTESTQNAAGLALWEFDVTDDADLGHTFSEPTVALMNNGKWAVIIGNGYNDLGSGEAQLFIIYLSGPGADGNWDEGTDYIKITTEVGTTADRNGLSTPGAFDTDGDGDVDRVYAGDLYGNMWAFDLSANQSNQWEVAYSSGGGVNAVPAPLFTTANGQPITTRPELSLHLSESTTNQNKPNIMVYFGTGQYLVEGDKASTATQSFYGVWDAGSDSLTRSDLLQQSFLADTNYEVSTDYPVDWNSQFGWYIDLPITGERVTVNSNLRDGLVYFNTFVPSNDPCAAGGSGYQNVLKMENGGRPDEGAFDYNKDGVIDADDLASITQNGEATDVARSREKFGDEAPTESSFLGNKEYTGGSGGTLKVREVIGVSGVDTGRLSWQELRR